MTEFTQPGIYFLPLGGADDIGMNMYVYAVDGKLIVVDAGYGFLFDYPGIELMPHLIFLIIINKI